MADSNAHQDIWVASSPKEGVVVGSIHGEIDLHNSPLLRSRLMESLKKWQPKKLILLMSKVPYVDSSAIAVLVETLKEIRRSGGRVMLAELQPRVKGLLEIARLDSIFVVAKTEQEALDL